MSNTKPSSTKAPITVSTTTPHPATTPRTPNSPGSGRSTSSQDILRGRKRNPRRVETRRSCRLVPSTRDHRLPLMTRSWGLGQLPLLGEENGVFPACRRCEGGGAGCRERPRGRADAADRVDPVGEDRSAGCEGVQPQCYRRRLAKVGEDPISAGGTCGRVQRIPAAGPRDEERWIRDQVPPLPAGGHHLPEDLKVPGPRRVDPLLPAARRFPVVVVTVDVIPA